MKCAFRLRFVLLLLLAANVAAQSGPLQQGVDLFRQGRYEEALRELTEAQRTRPDDAVLENLIGVTETKLGQTEEANHAYESAIRLNPKLPGPHKNLAFNYLQAGQYALAEAQLKIALTLDGSDPAVHYYLILVYLSTKRDPEVVANLEAAKEFLKADSDTAALAIDACLRTGASAQAGKLADLIESGSGFSLKREYDLAKDFSDKGLYLDAAQRYRKVMQITPDAWEAKYDLAITLAKAKQTVEASSLLTSLEGAHQSDPKILSLVASAAEGEGNLALAVKALKSAITADPSNPDRYLDCTRVLMDLDRNDEAAEIVKRGITLVPDPYVLNIRLGAIEMMRGNHEKATADYQRAIEAHPEVALGYVALAQTYMKDGDLKQALKVLTDGRSKVPPDYALEYVFGLVSSTLGQQEPAIAAFLHSEQLNPDVAETHYQLGIIYFQQGQLKKAQDEFESVLRLDESYSGAYYQLSRIYARMGDMPKAHQMAAKAQELSQTQKNEAIKAEKDRLGSFQPQ